MSYWAEGAWRPPKRQDACMPRDMTYKKGLKDGTGFLNGIELAGAPALDKRDSGLPGRYASFGLLSGITAGLGVRSRGASLSCLSHLECQF
jgi:hypothetical protein